MTYSIFCDFVSLLKSGYRKYRWHKLHPTSDTIPMNHFDFAHVQVGNGTYGELNIIDFGGKCKLYLKNYISIAQNVTFVLNGEHNLDRISTFPFRVKTLHMQSQEAFGKGDIIVDDDVWIGYGATILSGLHIGQGAVIAAGAVVTKDVPPYAIAGGNPAKVLKYRFEADLIKELIKLDYSMLTREEIKEHMDELYMELKDVEQLEWMSKWEERS